MRLGKVHWLLCSLLLLSCVRLQVVAAASAFWITILAGEQQCFHEPLEAGMTLRLFFAVSEGGNHDIEVKITGPDEKMVGFEPAKHDDIMEVTAYMDGDYRYCFNNHMSSVTNKELMFHTLVSTEPQPLDDNNKDSPGLSDQEVVLTQMIRTLQNELSAVVVEKNYMTLRKANHKELAESTNTKVLHWAALESFMIVAMSFFQIYYLVSVFETKSIV